MIPTRTKRIWQDKDIEKVLARMHENPLIQCLQMKNNWPEKWWEFFYFDFFVSCINSEFERRWWLTFGSALMKLPLCLMPSKQKDLLSLQSSRSNAQNRVSLRLFLKFKLCFLSEKEMTPESYCKICQTLFSKSKVRDKSITKIYVVWK